MDLDVDSQTSSMSDIYESYEQRLDQYKDAFKAADGQVGALFAINGKIQGLELFDSSETFSHYLERLVSSYALSSLSERGESEPLTALDAEKFIDSVKKAKADAFVALGNGSDLRLSGEAVSGGALMAEERIVHLAAFATQSARQRKRHMSRRLLDRTTH